MAPIHKNNSDSLLHGYDVKLCDEKELQRYRCPLCNYLIRNPIQTERGELACEYCYKEAKREDGTCPIDGEPLYEKEFNDKGRQRDILKLECYCYYGYLGCDWKGQLRHFEDHVEECEYKPMNCRLCRQELPPSHLSSHLEGCPELLPNGCIYKGCPYKPESVEGLKEHLKNGIILHAYLQSSTIMNMEEQMSSQSSFYENLMKEKDEERESEVNTIKLQMCEMSEMMKTLMTNQNTNNKKIEKLEENKSENASSSQTDSCNNTQNHEVEKLGEQVNLLNKNMSDIDLRLQLQEKTKNASSSQTDSSKSTPNREVEKIAEEVNLINKNISDVDLRLQLHENTRYDGKLIWKIDNIKTRLDQAATGRVTALHSAPTFTERNEYKFCARLYLNGDGCGRGSHVSLFFVLMKSEYDSLLEWPFKRRVSFKLINQKKKEKSITESFMPDAKSSSFTQPKKEMNIASGCPTLISLHDFNNGGFIKDDCVFIEVEIGPESARNSPVARRVPR